jgi:hypothetical protein
LEHYHTGPLLFMRDAHPKGASLGFCERLHYTLPFGSAP